MTYNQKDVKALLDNKFVVILGDSSMWTILSHPLVFYAYRVVDLFYVVIFVTRICGTWNKQSLLLHFYKKI